MPLIRCRPHRTNSPRFSTARRPPAARPLRKSKPHRRQLEPKVTAAEVDGWSRVECDLRGGLDGAAEAIAFLARAGVNVARCEPVKLSLADLLERVLARHANA